MNKITVDENEIKNLIELNNNLKNYNDNNDENNNLLENIEIIDEKLNKLLPPKTSIYKLICEFFKLFIGIFIIIFILFSCILVNIPMYNSQIVFFKLFIETFIIVFASFSGFLIMCTISCIVKYFEDFVKFIYLS